MKSRNSVIVSGDSSYGYRVARRREREEWVIRGEMNEEQERGQGNIGVRPNALRLVPCRASECRRQPYNTKTTNVFSQAVQQKVYSPLMLV